MKNSGLRPWSKGQSGNPSGRPGRIAKLRAALLEREPAAFAAFDEMLKSEKERLEAFKLWLSYCYGPPPREEDNDKGSTAAYAFFHPLTEEQVKLHERMIKALPEGETAGGTAEAMSPGGASEIAEHDP